MESLGLIEIAMIVGSSIGGAALIVGLGWVLSRMTRSNRTFAPGTLAPTFLFDGDKLSDATLDAQNMLEDAPSHLSERQALLSMFKARFPTLSYIMDNLPRDGVEVISASDDIEMSLQIEDVNGMIRVTLLGAETEDRVSISQIAAHDAVTEELGFLRSIVDSAPFLMWKQDDAGKLTWANATYMALSDQHADDSVQAEQNWPDKSIFPELHIDGSVKGSITQRTSLPLTDHMGKDWFEITSQRHGKDALHFAADANATVKAEESRTRAMQTSGRLFGDLSTGLAIFDQNRRLSIFNPSLTDLTNLSPSFLTTRPTLDMFLDALRESRILPEPKNYTSWRDQFTALETAARAGTYCENWDLIDGQTFRVTGRPYADKSFVFLFEDITPDVQLTRQYKSSMATAKGVIDTMDTAVAVFSANGIMVLSNTAYEDLWESGHNGSLHTHDLRSEIGAWQRHCAAAPSWSDLRSFIASGDKTDVWLDHAVLDDGRQLECRAQSIAQGMTMVKFDSERKRQKMSPIIHKLTLSDPSLQSAKS